MGIGKLIKKYLCAACVCFTVVTAIYMLIMVLIYPEDDKVLVEASSVVLFFVFSVIFSTANAILSIEKINAPLRYVAHYLLCVFGFYTCLLLPYATTGAAIIFSVVFTFFYVIVMVIIGVFRSRLRKNREATAAYTKQFNKKK